jgi:hypothetical protein
MERSERFFPSMTPVVPVASMRTALWRVRYSRSARAVVGVAVEPARIDRAGVPRRVAPLRAARETAAIQRCGRRALARSANLWRMLDMLGPAFIALAIYNYCAMLKRRGLRFVWRSVVAGIKAHRI